MGLSVVRAAAATPVWAAAIVSALTAGVVSAQGGPALAPAGQPPAPAPPKPAPPPWTAFTADLGFVNTSGNTNVSTLNVSDGLTVFTDHSNKVTQAFGLTYGTVSNRVRTSLWTGNIKDAYTFAPSIGVYALAQFDRNTFAGIEQRFEEGAGVALIPLNHGPHHLEIDLGASYIEQRSTAAVEDNYPAGRGALTYQYNFSKSAYIEEAVEVIPDLKVTSDYRINSETDFVAPVSKRIAIKVGYAFRYANEPPPGFKTTDRLLTTDLQFNF